MPMPRSSSSWRPVLLPTMAAMKELAVHPSSVWAAAAGDLREGAQVKAGGAGEPREAALASKGTGRRWAGDAVSLLASSHV